MPSMEETIALTTREIGEAREEILGLVNVASTQITRVGREYERIVATFETSYYVDQENGSDDNEGKSEASPLKSIQKCVELTPRNGIVYIRLLNDYIMREEVTVENMEIMIISASAVRHKLMFERYIYNNNGTTYRQCHGFAFATKGSIKLQGIEVVYPSVDNFGSHLFGTRSYPFRSSASASNNFLAMYKLSLNVPENPFAPLIGIEVPLSLMLGSIAIVDQPYVGMLLEAADDPAGTNTASLSFLTTNLVTV